MYNNTTYTYFSADGGLEIKFDNSPCAILEKVPLFTEDLLQEFADSVDDYAYVRAQYHGELLNLEQLNRLAEENLFGDVAKEAFPFADMPKGTLSLFDDSLFATLYETAKAANMTDMETRFAFYEKACGYLSELFHVATDSDFWEYLSESAQDETLDGMAKVFLENAKQGVFTSRPDNTGSYIGNLLFDLL